MNMMHRYIFYAVIAYLSYSICEADISCLQCSNTRRISDCSSNNVTCSGDMKCFAERTLDKAQHSIYNAGCRTPQLCKAIASKKRDMSSCSQCCDGSETGGIPCNAALCNFTDIPANKPINCVSCNNLISDGDMCTTVKECNETQLCSTGVHLVSGIIKYSYKCMDKDQCNNSTTSLKPQGDDGIIVCRGCCTEDRCNARNCYELTKDSTTTPTTYVSPMSHTEVPQHASSIMSTPQTSDSIEDTTIAEIFTDSTTK